MEYFPSENQTQERLETLCLERSAAVSTVWLNRPDKHNAMNPTMHREMADLLTMLASDRDTKVVVLRGAGRSFSSGMDLKEHFVDTDDGGIRDRIRFEANLWSDRLLRMFPKPTIAMVHGYCFGGAFTVLASCDIALTSTDATYGLSEINWGGSPAGLVAKNLTELMTPRQALYLAMTGERFDGSRAVALGLATRAISIDNLETEVFELARRLAESDLQALRTVKESFKQVASMSHETAYWWLMAKSNELRWRQMREGRDNGLAAFAAGSYRPGFEAYQGQASEESD